MHLQRRLYSVHTLVVSPAPPRGHEQSLKAAAVLLHTALSFYKEDAVDNDPWWWCEGKGEMGREIERKENGKYCPSDDFQTQVWCRYVFYLSILVENCERETEKIGETPNRVTHAACAGKMAAVSFHMDVRWKQHVLAVHVFCVGSWSMGYIAN